MVTGDVAGVGCAALSSSTVLNLEVQFLNGGGGHSEQLNLVRIFCSGRTPLLHTCLTEPLN